VKAVSAFGPQPQGRRPIPAGKEVFAVLRETVETAPGSSAPTREQKFKASTILLTPGPFPEFQFCKLNVCDISYRN
jgi:hypothetical protein